MPLKISIAVNAEATIALSMGIVVNIDINKKVIAPATRLRGSQLLIAEEDLITLHYLVLYPHLLITSARSNLYSDDEYQSTSLLVGRVQEVWVNRKILSLVADTFGTYNIYRLLLPQ